MMGREIRMVPADWEHPKKDNGDFEPLLEPEKQPLELVEDWAKEARQWERGEHPTQSADWAAETAKDCKTYLDWHGPPPDPSNYMPFWPDEEKTHFQMYESTSEGTPLSPVMDNPEKLARWLADNGASAFGSDTASYEEWLSMIKGPGWAPSAMAIGGVMQSGVAGMAKT